MKRIKQILALLLVVPVLLSGCTGRTEQPAEKRTICVVLKALDSVHWLSVEDGLKQAANDYGVSVNILWPKNENDITAQTIMIEDIIDSQPDAIAVAPCNSGQIDVMQDAVDAGIPCFYIDTRSEQFDFPYIGSDNRNIGELAARTLSEQLDSGKVAVIMGNRKQSSHTERLEGFQTYLEENTDLELCAVKESPKSNSAEAMQCMQELLEEHPDLKGVFCTSAMMVMGAVQQRDNLGYSGIELVGVDTQSDAMTCVKDGRILALIGQNGYQIGYQTIRTIVQSLDGQAIRQENYVENPVITQENVDRYMEEYLTERGGES
ncbi:MAG: sugar ABC transporter substrate-binding protein [Butyricicoccaceae bacterium]